MSSICKATCPSVCIAAIVVFRAAIFDMNRIPLAVEEYWSLDQLPLSLIWAHWGSFGEELYCFEQGWRTHVKPTSPRVQSQALI
jgi:hypothetical protein